MKKGVDAIGTLLAYSFITRRDNSQHFDIHPLVHLATRAWLKGENKLEEWTAQCVSRLVDVFPTSDHENKRLWAAYLPHARYVLKSHQFRRENPETWPLLRKIGLCLLADGMYFEAEGPLTQIMNLNTSLLGETHPDSLTSMSDLALTFIYQSRLSQAEALEERVLTARQECLGPEHPDTLTSMQNLAFTYHCRGRLRDAEKLSMSVIEISKRVLGQEHPNTLTSMDTLTLIYRDQGRWKEAEALLEQLIRIRKKVLSEDHPDTLRSIENHANLLKNKGKQVETKQDIPASIATLSPDSTKHILKRSQISVSRQAGFRKC